MAPRSNRKIVLVKRPKGEVTADCLKLVEEPAPEPKDGEALVRNLYLSLDPTQQGWMKYDTYLPAIPLGDVVRSAGVGEVIESRSPHYPKGQLVSGLVGWQEYAIAGERRTPHERRAGRHLARRRRERVRHHGPHRLLRAARRGQAEGGRDGRGVGRGRRDRLGGRPDREDRGLPRGRHRGRPRQVPLARARARLRRRRGLQERGRRQGAGRGAARTASTSTSTTWAARSSTPCCSSSLAARASSLCGAISTYSEEAPPPGPRNLMMLVMKHAHMEGFLVLDYVARFPEAIDAMSQVEGRRQAAQQGGRGGRHREHACRVPAPVHRREHREAAGACGLMRRLGIGLAVVAGLALAGWIGARAALEWYGRASQDPEFFADEIAAFEAADREHAPPGRPIVFVGSSSIRLWKTLAEDMAPLPVINRGFGGSQLAHAIHFADRIVVPYRPRAVVLYAGDNDLDERTGKTAADVVNDFQTFAGLVHAARSGCARSTTSRSSHRACAGRAGPRWRRRTRRSRRSARKTRVSASSTSRRRCSRAASRPRASSSSSTGSISRSVATPSGRAS